MNESHQIRSYNNGRQMSLKIVRLWPQQFHLGSCLMRLINNTHTNNTILLLSHSYFVGIPISTLCYPLTSIQLCLISFYPFMATSWHAPQDLLGVVYGYSTMLKLYFCAKINFASIFVLHACVTLLCSMHDISTKIIVSNGFLLYRGMEVLPPASSNLDVWRVLLFIYLLLPL